MKSLSQAEGILVGCDQNQEWLLPWWWEHYSKHNSYPVAFVNFGMSEKALAWCQERGKCVTLPSDFSPLKTVSTQKKEQWETRAGSGIWPFRSAWFKKPLAFLSSPFALTCWIDLDCEIKGALDPLFNVLVLGDIALVREPENVQGNDREQNLIFPDEITYNSGVVVFRSGADILSWWAEAAFYHNNQFMGDQNALSRAIYLHQTPVIDLPSIYNWKKDQGPNPKAVILHYVASWKLEILKSVKPDLFKALHSTV